MPKKKKSPVDGLTDTQIMQLKVPQTNYTYVRSFMNHRWRHSFVWRFGWPQTSAAFGRTRLIYSTARGRELSKPATQELFLRRETSRILASPLEAASLIVPLAQALGLELSEAEIEAAVQEVDVDGSGQLDFPEFLMLMCEQMGDQDKVMEEVIKCFKVRALTLSPPRFFATHTQAPERLWGARCSISMRMVWARLKQNRFRT